MHYFKVLVPGPLAALSPVPGSAHQGMSRSLALFIGMVGVAAVAWALAMVALAGGWKSVSSRILERSTIASVTVFALLSTLILSVVVYRGVNRQHHVQIKVSERRPVRVAEKTLPPAHQQASVHNNPKPLTPPQTIPVPVPRSLLPKQSKRSAPTKEDARPKHVAVRIPVSNVARSVRATLPVADPPVAKTSIVVRGTNALSEVQTRQVCGAVGPFAGTQVYIKWSPGANSEQLARQLSKVMDCARVTVTYASVAGGLRGHGVQVGSHANEGETSDRIEPFADAITAALRAQGFVVTETFGPNIPTDQTAIFIGPE